MKFSRIAIKNEKYQKNIKKFEFLDKLRQTFQNKGVKILWNIGKYLRSFDKIIIIFLKRKYDLERKDVKKMLIYHGNTEKLESPYLENLNYRANFGRGFYTSIDEEAAKYWAEEKSQHILAEKNNLKEQMKKYVNVYEFTETEDLKILDLSKLEEFDFAFLEKDKSNNEFKHDYDIIKGPVIIS